MIKLNSETLNFQYNTINFSGSDQRCGCVELERCGYNFFKSNIFEKAAKEGIYCSNCEKAFEILIENNTFDQIFCNQQGGCIHLANIRIYKIAIVNNTIENCSGGGSLIKIGFRIKLYNFTFKSLKFFNNYVIDDSENHSISEPLILFENTEEDESKYEFKLFFENCYFYSNSIGNTEESIVGYKGSNENIQVNVQFNHCYFDENQIDDKYET